MRSVFVAVLVLLGVGRLGVAQECRPVRTALVLSGGGAKGLAHIGVLQVLDSLGIRPDLIVGTSMGAIIGALYASGYDARQIDSLARALPVSDLAQPFRGPAPHPWDHRIPLVFMVRGRNGFEFQTGIVDETRPNARLNAAMLRGNLLARGQFDRLPIPFRAVATDLRDRSTVVLADGDLARAVRASSAIPLVFPPVIIGSAVLVDGGLSANIPAAEARAAGALRVIVSDMTEHPQPSLDVESPLALADQLLAFLFHQPPAALGAGDVMVRPDVNGFRSLDFSAESVSEILRRGRAAADTTIGRASCLPHGARPPVPAVPGTLVDWRVTTGSPGDSTVVARMLRLAPGAPINEVRLGDDLVGMEEAEAFRGIWLNPTGSADSVRFAIEPIRAPTTVSGGGVAYDNDLGGRAWAGLFDRTMFGPGIEASVLASVGRYGREVYGAVLWHVDAGWSRITPNGSLRIRREDIRRFDGNGQALADLGTTDLRASGGVEIRIKDTWRIRPAAEYLAWGGDGLAGRRGAGASIRVERDGREGPQLMGEAIGTGQIQLTRLTAVWPVMRRRWNVVPTLRLGWGSNGLPAQWTFPLGGDDGFPGLHIGERRGTRDLDGSVRLSYGVKGPIQARVLLAAGRAWSGPFGAGWLAGGRFGLGADTPLGPMDAAYGLASNGRGAFYLRLGKWF